MNPEELLKELNKLPLKQRMYVIGKALRSISPKEEDEMDAALEDFLKENIDDDDLNLDGLDLDEFFKDP
jgi:hypothetical protein